MYKSAEGNIRNKLNFNRVRNRERGPRHQNCVTVIEETTQKFFVKKTRQNKIFLVCFLVFIRITLFKGTINQSKSSHETDKAVLVPNIMVKYPQNVVQANN